MGSRLINVIDGSRYGTSYSISTPSVGSLITSAGFNSLVSSYNSEYVRRNQGNPGYGSPSGLITASTLAAIANGLNNLGGQAPTGNSLGDPGQDVSSATLSQINQNAAFYGAGGGAPGNMASGNKFYASDFSALATAVINAGAQCLCNCNYCTCNCNYCTCNCDYSCTCNCNYSDERLKENIKLIDTNSGLNVYSYTYLWDKTKTFIGVLAQELVGTKYESALGKDTNGYYFVDYSQLPVTFKEV
jgi:hypothetical protein